MRRNDVDFKAEILRRTELYRNERRKKRIAWLSGAGAIAACLLLFTVLFPGLSQRNELFDGESHDGLQVPGKDYVAVNGMIYTEPTQTEPLLMELDLYFPGVVQDFAESDGEPDQDLPILPSSGDAFSAPESALPTDDGTDFSEEDLRDSSADGDSTGSSAQDFLPGYPETDGERSVVIEVCHDGEVVIYTLFPDRICSADKTVRLTEEQAERLWDLFYDES